MSPDELLQQLDAVRGTFNEQNHYHAGRVAELREALRVALAERDDTRAVLRDALEERGALPALQAVAELQTAALPLQHWADTYWGYQQGRNGDVVAYVKQLVPSVRKLSLLVGAGTLLGSEDVARGS